MESSAATLTTPSEQESSGKTRIFSGIQPTGTPHLGNYLGAIRNWVDEQHHARSIHCIVDLHSMTLPFDASTMRERTRELAAGLLASGIDPELAILFVQSDVREHTELTWYLSTQAMYGELSRMTQFKDKSRGQGNERIPSALFFYPVLMAADILLYDTDSVPVGDDQRQHVELARDIAQRFNGTFGETFVVPEADIREVAARVMALDDPTSKMSKSAASEYNYISLADDDDTIRRKVRRAVTDSGSEIVAGPDKPAITNLLTILSAVTDTSVAALEEQFQGKGYGDFKNAVAEALVEKIGPIREQILEYRADPGEVDRILERGAERAREMASVKIEEVRQAVGLKR